LQGRRDVSLRAADADSLLTVWSGFLELVKAASPAIAVFISARALQLNAPKQELDVKKSQREEDKEAEFEKNDAKVRHDFWLLNREHHLIRC
jgi:hypothetical protein